METVRLLWGNLNIFMKLRLFATVVAFNLNMGKKKIFTREVWKANHSHYITGLGLPVLVIWYQDTVVLKKKKYFKFYPFTSLKN